MSLQNVGPVVLVGAGQMGMAMAIGWLDAGLASDQLILVDPKPSEPVKAIAEQKSLSILERPPSNPAQVLVLAVKPQVAAAVLVSAKMCVGPDTLALSVMAGIGAEQMSSALGCNRIVRTIPNTPAKIGKGAIGAFASAGVDASDRDVVNALLAASGQTIWVENESDIDSVTGLSGSGPAYVFNMVEAMAKAGEAQGLPAVVAMKLARQTIIGAAALMDAEPDVSAATLRENVTSPNGTTYAALQILMGDEGLSPLMERAVTAARERSEELGA